MPMTEKMRGTAPFSFFRKITKKMTDFNYIN